jgi:DNA-binding transcriptional regulator WhiA
MTDYQNKKWLEEMLKIHKNGSAIAKATGYPVTCVNRYIRKYELQNKRDIQPNRKYSLNEEYFKHIDTEKKAYWYGFFMADGCMYHSKTSYDIQFTLALKDLSHLEKFSNDIQAEQKPEVKEQGGKNVAFYRISSKKMYNDLIQYGASQRKTGKETIPLIDKKFISHFIRGFFDGDGSFYIDEDNYITCAFVITCSNKSFIDELYNHFNNLFGIEFNVIYQNGAYSMRTTSKEKCYKIYKYIYDNPTVYLDRKYKLIKQYISEYSPQCE